MIMTALTSQRSTAKHTSAAPSISHGCNPRMEFCGYLSALAVMRRPDRFHVAVAGAPVTEWRWYDTHYTERYLESGRSMTPPIDDHRSSKISVTRTTLLLIHGLADDDVVAAHTLQLPSALLSIGALILFSHSLG